MYQKSINWKQEVKKSVPIVLLINKYFWKTKVGPLFSFLFPFLLMIVYLAISKSKNDPSVLVSSLPSIISLSILPLTLLTLASMNIEFRNSIILRKIKIIGISRFLYLLINYFLFTIYSLLFFIVNFFLFCCFLSFQLAPFKLLNWGSMVYGLFLLIFSAIALGLMLSIFSKTALTSQLIGLGVMLLTLIFSGQFMPLSVIGSVNALKYISLFSPLSYSANIFNVALYTPYDNLKDSLPDNLLFLLDNLNIPSNNIFDFSSGFWLFQLDTKETANQVKQLLETTPPLNPPAGAFFEVKQVNIYDVWQKVLFVFFPFVFMFVFSYIFIIKFKWISR